MASAPGLMVPVAIRVLRNVVRKGISIVKDRLPRTTQELLEPALVRNVNRGASGRLGHALYTRSTFNNARNYSTRHSASTTGGARIRHAVGRITASSPFATPLRPKLCGALPRSQGGYSLGGSARYYSHAPAATGDVIYQVSQAMRAFILSGKDTAYNARRGGHRSYIKGQIRAQLAASSTDSLAPGAYVDFRLTPTLTCLAPHEPVGTTCLDGSRGGFLEELNADFSGIVSDVSAVFQDLRRLSSLGDLPISLVDASTLRVHFRGCDAELVNRLCDDVGVCRGVVHEDERFAFDRLAPSVASGVDWKDMMSDEDEEFDDVESISWSGEEFYDEIDPGGSSSSTSSFVISRGELEDNPWA